MIQRKDPPELACNSLQNMEKEKKGYGLLSFQFFPERKLRGVYPSTCVCLLPSMCVSPTPPMCVCAYQPT